MSLDSVLEGVFTALCVLLDIQKRLNLHELLVNRLCAFMYLLLEHGCDELFGLPSGKEGLKVNLILLNHICNDVVLREKQGCSLL